MSKIIGIDLGTTNSAVAIIEGGQPKIIENVEGMLVGITDRYLNNSTGAGSGSMIIKTYSGGSPQVEKEVFTLALSGKTMPLSKALKNNRLFFSAKIMTNTAGTLYREGIWSFGRKNKNYPFVFTLDFINENVDVDGIQAFGAAANFFFIAHSDDGSIDKTNDAATYAFTSIYESLIFDFGDVTSDKQLNSLKVSFRKLATGESLTAKYRLDGATSWTTIGTFSTVGELSHTFLREETNDKDFASGKEFEFRFESSGGLEITSYQLEAVINDTP